MGGSPAFAGPGGPLLLLAVPGGLCPQQGGPAEGLRRHRPGGRRGAAGPHLPDGGAVGHGGGYAVSFVLASLVGGGAQLAGGGPGHGAGPAHLRLVHRPPLWPPAWRPPCGDLMETVLLRAEAGGPAQRPGGHGVWPCCTWRPSKPWGCGAENRSGPRRGIVFSPGMGYTGGNHPGGFLCRRLWGAVHPSGGWLEATLGRSALGPRLPGGGPHFSREMGRKGAGALPLDPRFYGPLAAARSFWRLCHIVPVVGLFRRPSSYPDLETFFHKMLFQHIFPGKCVPNRS